MKLEAVKCTDDSAYSRTDMQQASSAGMVHNGKKSKIERYNWAKPGAPGELTWVSKLTLEVDRSYQRDIREGKVKEITNSFSWPAFGVLIVARRKSGRLFIVEGQHRHAATLRRIDIDTVPCVVFDIDDSHEESKAFIAANTLRKTLSGFEKHKASVLSGNKASKFVDDLARSAGRTLAESNNGGRIIGCVRLMTKLASEDPDTLARVFTLLDGVVGPNPIKECLLDGVFWVESHMPQGESLNDARWRKRLAAIGAVQLESEAKRMAAAFSKGGAGVWGRGILMAINKGLQRKLVLPGVDEV